VPVPVVVEFIAGTAGLSAGIGAMEAKMAGLKASSEASMRRALWRWRSKA
jgi:hypothetical protein